MLLFLRAFRNRMGRPTDINTNILDVLLRHKCTCDANNHDPCGINRLPTAARSHIAVRLLPARPTLITTAPNHLTPTHPISSMANDVATSTATASSATANMTAITAVKVPAGVSSRRDQYVSIQPCNRRKRDTLE